jgi:hypothetical protein
MGKIMNNNQECDVAGEKYSLIYNGEVNGKWYSCVYNEDILGG